MTVANNYAPIVTAATGSVVQYSGTWNAISAAYLVVQLQNVATNVYTTVTQGTGPSQYQVISLTISGFVIQFNTAPVTGNNVIISRNTAPEQDIPYTTSRGFQGSTEEGSFDALTTMVQELIEASDRALKFNVGSPSLGSVPEPIDGYGLIWDGVTGALRNTASSLAVLETNAALVGGSIANVNAVAGDLTNINAVAANASNINAVAAIASQTAAVGNNITAVTTVASNISTVGTVAANITNVNAVGGSIANVNAVAGDLTNINAVQGDLANINSVAGDLTNINICATNITAINNAPAAATNAANSATAASNSAAAAAASAALAAGSLIGTSTTSNTVGLGAKSFTTQTGLDLAIGGFVTIAETSAPANYMHGQVTTYNSGTGAATFNILDIGGTGTHSDWTISVSGPAGPGGVNGGTAGQLGYYAVSGATISGNANATVSNGALTMGVAGTTQGSLGLAGSTSGTTTIAAPVSGGGTQTLQAGSDTIMGRATTDTMTNKTYDTAGTGNVFKINGAQVTSIGGNLSISGGVLNSTGGVSLSSNNAWTGTNSFAQGISSAGDITLGVPATPLSAPRQLYYQTSRTWGTQVNSSSNNNRFEIENYTLGNIIPFWIDGSAPVNSLIVGNTASPSTGGIEVRCNNQSVGNLVVKQCSSQAAGGNVQATEYLTSTTTTNATAANMNPINGNLVNGVSDGAYILESKVVARRTGGTAGTAGDSAGFVVRGVYKVVSGLAILVGSVSTTTIGNSSTYACTYSLSSGLISIQCTGLANVNINWHAETQIVWVPPT